MNDLKAFAVLIETLWNVKAGGTVEAISLAIGINRNIVECKEVDVDKLKNK